MPDDTRVRKALDAAIERHDALRDQTGADDIRHTHYPGYHEMRLGFEKDDEERDPETELRQRFGGLFDDFATDPHGHDLDRERVASILRDELNHYEP